MLQAGQPLERREKRPSAVVNRLLDRIYRDSFPILAKGFVGHGAVDLGKQGVVPTATNVGAGVDNGPQLAHQKAPGFADLSAETLNSAPLSRAVAAVS